MPLASIIPKSTLVKLKEEEVSVLGKVGDIWCDLMINGDSDLSEEDKTIPDEIKKEEI